MSRWSLPGPYSGISFRSHTEAKWACFLDHLDIRWHYEPQGFATDNRCYLPDFWAWPASGPVWLEVKGDWETDPEGVVKFRQFAAQRPMPSRAALLSGAPAVEGTYLLIGGDENAEDPGNGPWEDDAVQWRPCPSAYHFDLANPGFAAARFAEDGCGGCELSRGDDRIRAAVNAARSLRFGRPPTGTAA